MFSLSLCFCVVFPLAWVLSSGQTIGPLSNVGPRNQLGTDFGSNVSQRQNPFSNFPNSTGGLRFQQSDPRFQQLNPQFQTFDHRFSHFDSRLQQFNPNFSSFPQQQFGTNSFNGGFSNTGFSRRIHEFDGFNRPIPRPTLIDSNGLPIERTDPRILPSIGGPPLFANLAPASHVLTSFLSLDSDQITPRNAFFRQPTFINPLLNNQFANTFRNQFGRQPGFQFGNQINLQRGNPFNNQFGFSSNQFNPFQTPLNNFNGLQSPSFFNQQGFRNPFTNSQFSSNNPFTRNLVNNFGGFPSQFDPQLRQRFLEVSSTEKNKEKLARCVSFKIMNVMSSLL